MTQSETLKSAALEAAKYQLAKSTVRGDKCSNAIRAFLEAQDMEGLAIILATQDLTGGRLPPERLDWKHLGNEVRNEYLRTATAIINKLLEQLK